MAEHQGSAAVCPAKTIDTRPAAPGENGEALKKNPGLHPPQESRTKKPPDHRAAPIERDEARRGLGRESGNFGQTQIVHQKASDGNLSAHIGENTDCAQPEIGMPPDRIVELLSSTVGCGFEFWQPETAD